MANRVPLKSVAAGFLTVLVSGGASANAITTADIHVTSISISADVAFALLPFEPAATARAGPDNLGNGAGPVSGPSASPTSADASIPSAAAHSDITANLADLQYAAGAAAVTGTLHASSNANLGGTNDFTQSDGKATLDYEFEAIGHTVAGNNTNVTFTVTFNGSLTGSADAFGTYGSEVSVEFGQFSDAFVFEPTLSFDMPLNGGPFGSQSDPIGSTILSETVSLPVGVDIYFGAIAEAKSNAANSAQPAPGPVPEPATLTLLAIGLGALLGASGLRQSERSQGPSGGNQVI